jgi:hypothetical protein
MFKLFPCTIKSRVMEAISLRIDEVQKKYEGELEVLERKHEDEKTALLDDHVNTILTKFL